MDEKQTPPLCKTTDSRRKSRYLASTPYFQLIRAQEPEGVVYAPRCKILD